MRLLDHVAALLGLDAANISREVQVGPSARVDAVIHGAEADVVVEVKSRPPRPEDVAQLLLHVTLWKKRNPGRPVRGVTVVPGASPRVRALAAEAGVELLEVPSSLLPREAAAIGKTPLATEQSWAVVVTVLRHLRTGSLRDLAKASGASLGWTHRVVHELEARGAITRTGRFFQVEDVTRILDAIAGERPLNGLLVEQVPTGFDDAADLALVVMLKWNEIRGEEGKAGLHLCGVTAAAEYTGYTAHGDRLDMYCDAPEAVRAIFQGVQGGIEIRVHRPDRNIRPASTMLANLPAVSRAQALLDVAGTGLAFRDLTLRMLEAIRR